MRILRAGAIAAVACATIVVSATPAAAVSTYAGCNHRGDKHFEFAVNWRNYDANRIQVQSYSYKVYGAIRDFNNIAVWIINGNGSEVAGTRGTADEVEETTSWVVIPMPDFFLSKSQVFSGRGHALFDVVGVDPGCTATTGPL